ncbi:MAG: NUDIX domain-containing protein [Candidatus Pacebacteria bacterium]|nr:NUDIX domain-containing protein [Candidatus Paceibacterota bacterium]
MPQILPHRLTENVKLLHKVAVVVGQKALLLKRSTDDYSRPGKWDLPGGNSEWPQAACQAIKNLHQLDVAREIEEETGIKVDPDNFSWDKLVYFATYFNPETEVYSVNCGWWLQLFPDQFSGQSQELPEIKICSEHTEHQWISLDQLDQFDFGPAERDFEKLTVRRALAAASV